MTKFSTLMIMCLVIISCNTKHDTGVFKVSGEIKNAEDQKVYLEQLYFSQKDPEVLDTAEIKNGKFELAAIAPEEGFYRIRLGKLGHYFVFINDKPLINIKADVKNLSPAESEFNTPANILLKKLAVDLKKRNETITAARATIKELRITNTNDSLAVVENRKLAGLQREFKTFIIKFIDTASDPVVAMFALGYTNDIDPSELKNVVPNLAKRFPDHQGVASLLIRYNQYVTQRSQQPQYNANAPKAGTMAPDFTLNDVNDKSFSLNSFKGKYVLVDFWASWCAPCRAENPYVVAANNKYKDKNFIIIGVSLDDDKTAWINAINKDSLSWLQLSDLKGMSGPVASLYGINAIPFNVLLDPQGKIIATSLRGEALDQELNEVLQ